MPPLSSDLHLSGQRIIFLAPTIITTAVAATGTTPVVELHGMTYAAMESIFVYGAGGTNATVYLQTSFDGGTTWIDVMCHQYTTATLSKMSSVCTNIAFAAAAYVPLAPTDGALTANTCVPGLLGDRLRIKYVTTGTYTTSTTLSVYGVAKGG